LDHNGKFGHGMLIEAQMVLLQTLNSYKLTYQPPSITRPVATSVLLSLPNVNNLGLCVPIRQIVKLAGGLSSSTRSLAAMQPSTAAKGPVF